MHDPRIPSLQDYDCTVNYSPGKANVVADALSEKVKLAGLMIKEMSLLHIASEWKPRVVGEKMYFGNISASPALLLRIKEAQEKDKTLQK